jgi:hypothetical protein
VAIDLTWAEFAEDVAIDLFVAALRRSTEENRVALVNPPPALRGWLKTGVLAAEVTVRDDVADAVHVVRASPLDLPRA